MNLKAAIDEQGFVLGFYLDDMPHPEGAVMVAVSQQEHAALIEYPRGHFYDGSAWVEVPPIPIAPEQILAAMPAVSHAQIIAALILADIISEAEGVAWISGTLPEAVEAMIATLPPEQRVIARLRAIRPSSVVPTDPLVAALAAAQGQGVEDLIALFQTAAAL